MGQNLFSLEYGNCLELCANADLVYSKRQLKVNFERKKFGSSHWESSVSCTSKGYEVTTPYYPFFAPLSVKWSLTGG